MENPVFHFLCVLLMCVTIGAFAAELPLTRVTLFSSGVAHFQREGEIEGDATVELSFRTEQVNDLLKSLVLEDRGGGSIAPITYGSRDPITRTLKSFAVDITDAPPLAALLSRLRGVRISVSSTASAQETEGMVLGVEKQQQQVKDNIIIVDVLNLLTTSGMRSFPLAQVQQIRLLDTTIDSELRKALELLATSHDTQRKPVTLAFTGKGKRSVRVAYVLESPLWKTSYRLSVDGDRFFLQGWAIVENATDEDWKNVRLSLVSGRPISFIQDLYQPLYLPRPVVRPELYASLMPQTYEGEMEESRRQLAAGERAKRAEKADRALAAAPPMPAEQGLGRGRDAAIAKEEAEYLRLADSGVVSMAEAKDVGEMFQYVIEQPVTIARQKSAMLPIVNQEVGGEKVSIFNERVHAKYPLNGLRLKNATKLHLMQGPITVFDEGAYAGDARIENLQPGEERLVSYAMDIGVEVETQPSPNVDELVSVKVVKGVLFAERKYRMAKTYIVKNKSERKKVVLIEHPFNSAWRLIEPEKADERTPSVYRFRLNVEPRAIEKIMVKEGREDTQQIALISADLDTIFIYLRSKNVSDKVKAALQKAVEMKTALNDLANQRASIEQQLREIGEEQSRLRANMGAVPQNSELYARYMKKLGDQETQIEQLRETLKNLRAKETEQKKAVDDYLSGLEIE